MVLVSTYPIFVSIASRWLLRETPEQGMVAALVITTIGSVIIGLGDLGDGTHRLWGDVLALMGAVSGAGYFLIGRRLRARLSLLAYIFPVYGTAAAVLTILMWVSGLPCIPQQSQTWLWILLMTLGPQLLGHSSLNWALRYLSATYVTIAALAEPISSALLAWWILGEAPSVWASVGGALTLVGIAAASRVEQMAVEPAPTDRSV
jgi:drug/metabolite transporter (DMT)-like permease